MRTFIITIIILFLSGCDSFETWTQFAKALENCDKYEKGIFSVGLSKNIIGLDNDNNCLVEFYGRTNEQDKYISCKYNIEQRKEISKFSLDFDNTESDRAISVDINLWTFKFEVNGKVLNNPIQRTISDGSCSEISSTNS